ncbi:ULP-PROTEASE domain-containing protein [Mycena indigotica]|uniref:ULP-PROTEASE domain-containing protein n=1 Tax=Mycena indigotica TaxID=2126181 RepID=A0A8H6SG53_9AGAR|nr:ULP-PROTEASE domain-containing protein [Mycena indigotica]KAF7298896.1 ULP-PROTEASE domain-containing protein [Mycena indigotica]
MTALFKDDRKAVHALHDPPLSNRDASGTAGTWSQQPTRIQKPANPKPIRTTNPLSGRLGDNLHGPKVPQPRKSGNPVATTTFTNYASSHPPAKKPRLSGPDGRKKATPSTLNIRHRKSTSSDPTILGSAHEGGDEHRSHYWGDTPHTIEDGAATKDLRERLSARPPLAPEKNSMQQPVDLTYSDDDDIEEASSSPDKSKDHFHKGTVQARIQQFEGRTPLQLETHNSQPKRKKVDQSSPNTHPMLNLAEVRRPAGVKNAMKPKSGRTIDIALSKTAPVKIPAPPQYKQRPFLPITSWYMGGQLFHAPYHLSWEGTKLTFKSSDRPTPSAVGHREDIAMSSDARTLQYMEPDDNSEKIFVLELYPPLHNSRKRIGTTIPSEFFVQGDGRSKGTITVNLGKAPRAEYEAFIAWIKPLVQDKSVLRSVAGDNAWKAAVNSGEVLKTKKAKGEASSRSVKSTATSVQEESDDELAIWDNDTTAGKPSKHPGQKQKLRQHPSIIDLDPDSAPRTSRSTATRSRSQSEALSEPRPQRRSTRQSESNAQSAPDPNTDEVILVYPPGQTGAVNITNGDMERLRPNEFLNDTLIEFGLKLWLHQLEKENAELAQQIHVFSSFFYKKLNKRNFQESYASVAKWTSKFDLFDKKYIIVPINENLHWYLAIIYHPEHVLKPELPPPPSTKASPSTRSRTRNQTEKSPEADAPVPSSPRPPDSKATTLSGKSSPTENRPCTPISPSSNQTEAEIAANLTTCSIEDDAEMDPSDAADTMSEPNSLFDSPEEPMEVDGIPSVVMEVDDLDTSIDPINMAAADPTPAPPTNIPKPSASQFYSSKGKRKATSPPPPTSPRVEVRLNSPVDDEAPDDEPEVVVGDQPRTYIFTLDSLGTKHPRVGNILGSYLRQEALVKKNIPEEGSSKAAYKHALVPHQPNFCDCGLYLIHLAQTFFSDPDKYANLMLTRKGSYAAADRHADWKMEGTKDMRESLKSKIEELSVEWKRERAAKELEKKQQDAEVVADSSDDDIDIVETVPAMKSKQKSPRKKLDRMRG